MSENEIQEQAKQTAKYLVAFMGVELKRIMYHIEVKGGALACQIIGTILAHDTNLQSFLQD